MSNDRQSTINAIIVLKPTTPTTDQLSEFLKGLNNVELNLAETPVELIQLVNQLQPCIVLMSVPAPQQLPLIMSALKGQHTLAKRGRVKTMLISKIKNPQFRATAQKLNVAEFIEEPIAGRTLQFKVSLQIKALEALKKRDADLLAQKEAIEIRKGEATVRQEAYPSDVKLLPQVELEDDAFTFRGAKVKKHNQRIQFDLGGPDPASGDWVQHKAAEEGKTAWRWLPKDPNEMAAAGGPDGQDGWIAEGEKPVFEPMRKKWAMAGKSPELYFKKDGKILGKKVTTNKLGDLEVAEDSSRAEEKVRRALDAISKRTEVGPSIHKDLSGGGSKPGKIHDLTDIGDDDDGSSPKPAKIAGDGQRSRLRDERGEEEKESERSTDRLRAKFGREKAANSNLNPSSDLKSDGKEDENKLNRFKPLKERRKKEGGDIDDLRSPNESEEPAPVFDLLRPDRKQEGVRDQRRQTEANDLYAKKDEKKDDVNDLDLGRSDRKRHAVEKNAERAGGISKERLKSARLNQDDSKQAAIANLGKDAKGTAIHQDLDGGESDSGMHLDLRTPEKISELRANRKRKIVEDIQREMNRPIAKKLSREERQALAAEIDRPNTDLSDEELGKAAKIGRLKRLKKKLQDADTALNFDDDIEAETSQAANVHELKADNKPLRPPLRRPVTPDEKSKWSGHDSDQEAKETEWKGHRSEAETTKHTRDAKAERSVFHIPVRDIAVSEPAWIRAEPYYVCLSASTSYRGFDTLAHLLPIWCYEGDSKPELLVKESAWRFYDREPVYCRVLMEVPVEVKSYLLELNARIKADGITEELSDKEKKDLETRRKNRRDQDDQAESEDLSKADANDLSEKEQKLADLKDQLANLSDPAPEEAAEAGTTSAELRRQREAKIREDIEQVEKEIERAEKENRAAQKDKSNRKRNQKNEALDAPEETGDEKLQRSDDKRDDSQDDARDDSHDERLEKSNAAANDDESDRIDDRVDPIEEKPLSASEKMAELRRKLGEEDPTSAPVTAALEEKVKHSEAADFLAKRRERKEAAATQEGTPENGVEESAGRKHKSLADSTAVNAEEILHKKSENALSETLGIALLISDALYEGKDLLKQPETLLRMIAERFGACVAQLAQIRPDGKALLIGSMDEKEPAGAEINVTPTDPKSITYTDTANVIVNDLVIRLEHKPMGGDFAFLRLKAVEPRRTFTAADYRVLDAIAAVVADYWSAIEKARMKGRRVA